MSYISRVRHYTYLEVAPQLKTSSAPLTVMNGTPINELTRLTSTTKKTKNDQIKKVHDNKPITTPYILSPSPSPPSLPNTHNKLFYISQERSCISQKVLSFFLSCGVYCSSKVSDKTTNICIASISCSCSMIIALYTCC